METSIETTESLEVQKLREAFPEAILDVNVFRGDTRITVVKESVYDVCKFLRDDRDLSYRYISDVVGVDYLLWQYERPIDTRFEVVIAIYSHKLFRHFYVKYGVELGELAPSVTPLWGGANWPEREVYDMFGIEFENHPDMRRILMADDWIGHPLRKDYPLGGEEVPFAHGDLGPAVEDVQMPHAGESFEGKTGSENVSGR